MTAPLAYYNENDPYAAQYLRNLVDAGHIAFGVVDERSIEDVTPQELEQYTQCHFFAGVGIWSLALRMAGWPDNRPVWSGSCPCQPFSSAGKRSGFDDERHLWPSWYWLIEQCKPTDIFGEQVASKAVEPWIDLVQADLEAMGYAFGCVPFPSAGVGAPHIRDRAFWVANATGQGPQGIGHRGDTRPGWEGTVTQRGSQDGGMANPSHQRINGSGNAGSGRGVEYPECSSVGGLGDTSGMRQSGQCGGGETEGQRVAQSGETIGLGNAQSKRRGEAWEPGAGHSERVADASATDRPGPTNGYWRDADWLYCRDGKWRPVEPGTFPLAHGAPARVGRLRAYGNGINAIQAAEFIRATA